MITNKYRLEVSCQTLCPEDDSLHCSAGVSSYWPEQQPYAIVDWLALHLVSRLCLMRVSPQCFCDFRYVCSSGALVLLIVTDVPHAECDAKRSAVLDVVGRFLPLR